MNVGHASWVRWCLVLSCLALGLSACGKKSTPTGPTVPAAPTPVAGMVVISKGTFTLGSPDAEVGRSSDEGPQTAVTLTHDLWMGSTEVTQAQYYAVKGSYPSYFQPPNAAADLTRPVEQVSWDDAVAYCLALTTAERTAGRCPTTWEYRLPTEAEWEYAARAGTTTRFSYGDDPGYTLLAGHAWYSGSTTHPVGTTTVTKNAWGLSDMYGNVLEWCQDWYADPYPHPGGSASDPQGPSTGSLRVLRGGSWISGGQYCRSAQRNAGAPEGVAIDIGFRVVLAPVQP